MKKLLNTLIGAVALGAMLPAFAGPDCLPLLVPTMAALAQTKTDDMSLGLPAMTMQFLLQCTRQAIRAGGDHAGMRGMPAGAASCGDMKWGSR